MKNFHCFLLMVMLLVAMVHTATLKCNSLLHDIINDVQKICNHTFENIYVSKPSHEVQTCTSDFFCLAEKSLKPVKDSVVPEIQELHRHIKAYINMTNDTECTPRDSKYHIKHLLKDIEDCAKHRLSSKSKRN